MNLSVEHVLMIVFVAFALHYLMRNCGCRREGFSNPWPSFTKNFAPMNKGEGECCHWGDCKDGYSCDLIGLSKCPIGWSGMCVSDDISKYK